jgi:hypothetical protein
VKFGLAAGITALLVGACALWLVSAQRKMEEEKYVHFVRGMYLDDAVERTGRGPRTLDRVPLVAKGLSSDYAELIERVQKYAAPRLRVHENTQVRYRASLSFGWLGGGTYEVSPQDWPPGGAPASEVRK